MSNTPSPFSDNPDTPSPFSDNPHTPPQASFPSDLSLPTRKPGGLIAICILAIILGLLGLLSALSQVVSATVGARMQQQIMAGNSSGNMQKAQREMTQSMQGLTNRYKAVNITLAVFLGIVSACLFVGGILCMKLKPWGRKLLLIACLFAFFLETGKVIPQVMIQMQVAPIMEKYMARVMEDTSQENGQFNSMFSSVFKISMYFGIAIAIGWLLAKLIYFAVAIRYLKRQSAMRLFAAAQAPNPETPPSAAI